MQLVDFELPKGKSRIWDLDVPIVAQKNVTQVYITDSIDEPFLYNELCFLLSTASEAETFHLHLNTPGGHIDSAFMIIDAIKNSKAKVIAHLSGTVASAGTILALSCSELVIADHVAFMIHNYSGGMMGKGHEMKARQEFVDASLQEAFSTIYKKFLTPEEMTEVIDGKDMWMGKEEVAARFKGTFHKRVIDDTIPKRGRPRKED